MHQPFAQTTSMEDVRALCLQHALQPRDRLEADVAVW